MNRSAYFDYIEEKINLLALRIESRGKLNILNLHLHNENFYLHCIFRVDARYTNINEFLDMVV